MKPGSTVPRWGAAIIWAGGLVLIAASLLPLIPTDAGWIRILDFPRLQFAGLLVLLTGAALLLLPLRRAATWGLLVALVGAVGLQASRIWLYTPLHPTQAGSAEGCEPSRRLSVVVVNLQESNRGADAFLDLVRRVNPDVVFVVEVDGRWEEALRPLEEDFPEHHLHPRDDAWGLALYSRLPLVEPEVMHLLSSYVPSIRTGIRLRDGTTIAFHGLHPKPLTLSRSTAERDAELLLAAQAVREDGIPAIVAGDMNDVTWSNVTWLFQRLGGLLDPRVGRGLFTTFNAELPGFLQWPLDHIFFTSEFALIQVERLEDVGSDHFPMFVALCHAAAPTAASHDTPHFRDQDMERAVEIIENGRRDARRD